MDELKSCENINKNDLVVSAWLSGGCSSAVFKGEWHNDGKILVVAIKKMKVNSEEEAAEISRELKIMQSLPQENICKLYGCVVEDREREAWLVMEFAQGGDLHAFLQRHEGPLPKDLQLSFYIQATQALASLHNAPSPILHRDIKSFNYLVLPNNKLILADFGLSKAKALTTAETFTVGTVRWVAPEIVKTDRRHWSEKSDIYSLGMVYYEILTRELPYSEGHDAHLNRILDKIKNGTLPKLPDECPKDLAAIIQRCWSYKPEKRPTINELLALWAKVDLTDSPRKADKRKSKEKAVPPLAPAPPLTNSGKKKIPPPISPPIPTTESAISEHELTPFEAPLPPFSPRGRHQRAQSEFPARSTTPSLLSRLHKDKQPAPNESLDEILSVTPDQKEPQKLFVSKRAARHEINPLMKKIQEKGRILHELKAQMDAMVAQAGGTTLELEQSDAYKDLSARYSLLQEEVREAKTTLTTLTEKLWGRGTFETPTRPSLHRQRSYSLNSVPAPQRRNGIVKQFTSFKAKLSGPFSKKKEKAQSPNSYTPKGSSSDTEADIPATKHQVDPELLKQIIERGYRQENVQLDDTATRREGETMGEQREVNSEERQGRPRLGSIGKRK